MGQTTATGMGQATAVGQGSGQAGHQAAPAGEQAPAGGQAHPAGEQAPAGGQAVDRSGITALANALRSMTAPRAIVPAARRPPSGRELIALSGWAAVLGVVGLVIALRGVVIILANDPPSWFEPGLGVCGLVGIALTASGFVTARRRPLPWVFLGAATAVLIVSVVMSASA